MLQLEGLYGLLDVIGDPDSIEHMPRALGGS